MLVDLPSRARAELEVPSLDEILAARGDLRAIARGVFVHEDLDVDDLPEGDVAAICVWALGALAQTDDGLELAAICQIWGQPPSAVLGLVDLDLRWQLDRDLARRIRMAAPASGGDVEGEGGHVRFTTEEPSYD